MIPSLRLGIAITTALSSTVLAVACSSSDATTSASPDGSAPDGAALDSAADTSAGDASGNDASDAGTRDTGATDAGPDAPAPAAWLKGFGSAALDRGSAVAFDATGNVYLAGITYGSFVLGGTALDAMDSGVAGFLAKIDPTGSVLWVKQLGPWVGGPDVQVDPAGNVVVAFSLVGTVSIGGHVLTSAGGADVAFVKLDPAGNVLLAKRYGSAGNEIVLSVAATSTAIAIGGWFATTVDFGLGMHASNGNTDAYVLVVDANGTPVFDKAFGGPLDDEVYDLAIDSSGNVAAVGQMTGSIDFGGGALVSAGGNDGFAVSYSSSGAYRWAKRWGAAGNDVAMGVAVDGANDVAVTGNFSGSVDFGGGAIAAATNGSVFAVSLDTNGGHRWSKGLAGSDVSTSAFYKPLAGDTAGNLVLTGSFRGSIDFGGGMLASRGGYDAFFVKLSPTGQHVWSKAYGGTTDDDGQGVALSAAGWAALTGDFTGTATFGATMLMSSGGIDGFALTAQ